MNHTPPLQSLQHTSRLAHGVRLLKQKGLSTKIRSKGLNSPQFTGGQTKLERASAVTIVGVVLEPVVKFKFSEETQNAPNRIWHGGSLEAHFQVGKLRFGTITGSAVL